MLIKLPSQPLVIFDGKRKRLREMKHLLCTVILLHFWSRWLSRRQHSEVAHCTSGSQRARHCHEIDEVLVIATLAIRRIVCWHVFGRQAHVRGCLVPYIIEAAHEAARNIRCVTKRLEEQRAMALASYRQTQEVNHAAGRAVLRGQTRLRGGGVVARLQCEIIARLATQSLSHCIGKRHGTRDDVRVSQVPYVRCDAQESFCGAGRVIIEERTDKNSLSRWRGRTKEHCIEVREIFGRLRRVSSRDVAPQAHKVVGKWCVRLVKYTHKPEALALRVCVSGWPLQELCLSLRVRRVQRL